VPAHGVLLAGDHVLPSITPHISISRTDRNGDPLGDFLDSLRKVDSPTWPRCYRRIAIASPVSTIASLRSSITTTCTWPTSSNPLGRTGHTVADRGPLDVESPWEEFSLRAATRSSERDRSPSPLPNAPHRATRLKGVRPFTFALPEGAADAD